jgi:hypothetical protein
MDWTPTTTGQTIAHVKATVGPPTDAEYVTLLQHCHTHNWTAAHVRAAATHAGTGAPTWAQVNTNGPIFAVNWVGPRGAGGLGGAFLASPVFAGALGGGAVYQVQLNLRQQRVFHTENGHTFERNEFTFANCTRNANLTFYPLGTDVEARMIGHTGGAGAQALADQAAWGGFQQGNVGGDLLGIGPHGAPFGGGAGGQIYPTYLNQCYPTAGTLITDASLVAIGRLLGQIP